MTMEKTCIQYFNECIYHNVKGSKNYNTTVNKLSHDNIIARSKLMCKLKYEHHLRKSGYICISYFMEDADRKILYALSLWTFEDNTLHLKYVCVSPSIFINIGENRYMFVSVDKLDALIKDTSTIESYTKDRIKNGTLFISYKLMCYTEQVTPDSTMILSIGLKLFQLYCTTYHSTSNILHNTFIDALKLTSSKTTTVPDRTFMVKIMPMTVGETIRVGDLYFNVWKEIFVSLMCSDLFINGICYSFPISLNWTYINYVDPFAMFDTEELLTTIQDNEHVKLLIDKLMKFYDNTSEYVTNMNKNKATKVKVKEAMQSIIRNNLLSPISIIMLLEDTGDDVNSKTVVTDAMLFEVFYALYCLHTRLGIVHFGIDSKAMTLKPTTKANVAIVLEDEDSTYILPNIKHHIIIKNFEESIVGEKFLSCVETYIKVIDRVIVIDNEHIFTRIKKYSVYAEKHVLQLIEKLANASSIDDVINIIYPIDYIELLNSIKLPTDTLLKFYTDVLDANVKAFLKDIKPLYVTPFEQYFKQFKYNTTTTYDTLTDISVYKNEIKYSCTSYDKYPKWLQNNANRVVPSEFDIDISLKLLIDNLQVRYK